MRKFDFIFVYLQANTQPPSFAIFHYQKLFRRLICPRSKSIIEIVESEFLLVFLRTVCLEWLKRQSRRLVVVSSGILRMY